MNEIKIPRTELHLAAYVKSHGASFIDFANGCFIFESDTTENEWRVAHSNSCCLKTDVELFTLKKFLPRR
jgi:hypothetical protein